MQPELAYLAAAHARRVPLIGVCLGHQMIAAALGGKIGPMAPPTAAEWGFAPVTQHPIANTDIILAGVPWSMWQFHAHAQEVKELPPGATVLQSSERCKVQSFRVGLRTYAFQYHFECDLAMIADFCANAGDELVQTGLTTADIKSQADKHYQAYAQVSDRLCVNLASFLLPVSRRHVA
jgi:GMP synthase-like glutamine amidotransferase